MNANDWQDIDNVRNQAIAQLAEICAAMGLSWSADQQTFSIALPNIIVNKAVANISIPLQPTKRKTFDISTWGEKGPVEGPPTLRVSKHGIVDTTGFKEKFIDAKDVFPDDFQMPDYGEMLDEGVPPQGDPKGEK